MFGYYTKLNWLYDLSNFINLRYFYRRLSHHWNFSRSTSFVLFSIIIENSLTRY